MKIKTYVDAVKVELIVSSKNVFDEFLSRLTRADSR